MSTKTADSYDWLTSPIHRIMIVALDENDETDRYYEITGEQQLRELESFFPGYREFRSSQCNDWDTTRYRIYMCLYAGRTIKIISDGVRWGVTFGSIELNGDLNGLLSRIEPTLVRPSSPASLSGQDT